ncbi:unnamed protein product, partial [Rotaria sp. Silwood2]
IDAIRDMTENMRLSGVEVILDEGEGLMHTYALFHLWSPQSRYAQEKIGQWTREQLVIGIQSKSKTNRVTTSRECAYENDLTSSFVMKFGAALSHENDIEVVLPQV